MYLKKVLIILKILYFIKYRNQLEIFKINLLNSYRSHIFIDLKDKSITDIFTITFTFKITEDVNKYLGWFCLTYNNTDGVRHQFRRKEKKFYIDYEDVEIEVSKYYYFILEIKKTDITSISYKLNSNIKYGDSNNNYSSLNNSNNILYSLDIDDFNILLGSYDYKNNLSEYVKYENILIYNRSITNDEFQGIKLGDSKAIIFLNFSDSLTYSQYFHNKIDNKFLGGINGSSIYNDNNDIFNEFYKNTEIYKFFYLFDNKQFIKLSQEAIKYIHNFYIQNYLVYFKISLHLNYSSISSLNLNLNYNLYYRDNNTGMKVNLIKLKENTTNIFEIKLALINSTSENNIISTNEILNFDYLILTYNTYTDNNNLNIKLKYKITGETEDELTDTSLKSNFVSTNNHFIGNGSLSVTDNNINYILIEIEEFLFGRGTFLEKKGDKIYYDDIVLYCDNRTNNKIKRNDLNSCNNQRSDTIPLNSSNCELEDSDGTCIFKYPDVNETVNGNILNIERPYKQAFKSDSVINSDFDSNNNFTKTDITLNFININYNTSFNINNNFVIEIILIITNSLHGNIFEIEFNSNKYSKFVVNKNLSEQKFCWEINNSDSFNNPVVKIINLSNFNNFTVKSIKIIEIDNSKLVARDKKFIGEKVNNYYKILNNEEYSKEFFYDINDSNNNEIEDNYKITGNFLNKCYEGCKTCTGSSLLDCQSCMDGYLKFTDDICLKIVAINCKTYYNPFLCKTCVNRTSTNYIEYIKNFNGSYLCIECHSDCLIDTFCESCSNACRSCNLRYNIYKTCYNCPYECLLCSSEQIVCSEKFKIDCIKCKNKGINKYKNDINFPYECIQCNKQGYIDRNDGIEKCDDCDTTCKTCIGTGRYNCIECNDNFILNSGQECIAKGINNNICSIGYVHILKNDSNPYWKFDKCWECNSSCYKCKATNVDNCTGCKIGKYLFNDQCVSSCNSNGQFLSKELDSNNQKICKSCHLNCKVCISVENFGCIECITGKYLKKYNNGNGYFCTDCVENGYFKNNWNCLECSNNCLNCNINSYNCTSCKTGRFLDISENICILSCKKGTYPNENNICLNCNETCETCYNFGSNHCYKCKNDLYVDNLTNICKTCNSINNLIIDNICYKCHSSCRQCFGLNKNSCLNCKTNLFLNEADKTCINNCPTKTFKFKINKLNFCRQCFFGCLKCFNSLKNSCTECLDNFLFNRYTSTCLRECEIGYYKLNLKECEKCNINCYNCKYKNNCIKCKRGYILDENNQCKICDDGFYIYKNRCLKCYTNCKTCINYDNCLSCKDNRVKNYNKINKKNSCKLKCGLNQYYDNKEEKCDFCQNCKTCQIKNDFYCNECLRCKNNCYFNFKFNETGLYLFNDDNIYFNKFILDIKNKFIKSSEKKDNLIIFNIKKNNNDLKYLNFNFNNLSILSSKNCINKKSKIIVIKKIQEKICSITNINYNQITNKLSLQFNFKYNKILISNNFYYFIKHSKIDYLIKNTNFNNNYSIDFKFLPNYYKNKFSVILYFNKKIISSSNCNIKKDISKKILINSKNIKYKESEIKLNLNELKNILDSDNEISQKINEFSPVSNNVGRLTSGATFIGSLFPRLLSLLLRFSQVVYILDYILLLKLNLGKYTNSFIDKISFEYKLYINVDKAFGISKGNEIKKLLSMLIKNPKLWDFGFIYLTNWSIEFIFLIIIFVLEILFWPMVKIFKLLIKRFKRKITINKKEFDKLKSQNNYFVSSQYLYNKILKINWNHKRKINFLKKIIKFIDLITLKIRILKYVYIGVNMTNLLSSVFIYSQNLHLFTLNQEDSILILIYLFFFYMILLYMKEVLDITIDHYLFGKQNKKYRNEFYLFDNKKKGIHNYMLIISLIRDIIIIIFGLTFIFPIKVQVILFIIIQIIYVILSFKMNQKLDYKNIQLFKLQECLNLILLLICLILIFYKYDFFQFLFIVIYCFLILTSLVNFFFEFFYSIYKILKKLFKIIKKKFKIKKKKVLENYNFEEIVEEIENYNSKFEMKNIEMKLNKIINKDENKGKQKRKKKFKLSKKLKKIK